MVVDIGIILTYFSHERLCLVLRRSKERLFSLEDLLLDVRWCDYVEHAWQSDEEELLVEGLRSR